MPARVWCWTPNPVLEIKFTYGKRAISVGGKSHNVARQLHAWGVPAVSMVAQAGPNWLQVAQGERIRFRQIPVRSEARTGWALVEAAGQRLDFFTKDPYWKIADWKRFGFFLRRLVRSGDWLVVAGSVPTGARLGGWRNLFRGLKKQGVRIVVDGKGQLLQEALEAGVEWAKANQDEAEETLRRRGVAKCLVRMRSLSNDLSRLLITRGARGLVIQTGKKRLTLPAPRVRLRDATGSGDVVTAALIYGIRKGWEIEKIAGFAVWAGSENAARRNEVVARLKGRGVFA